MSITLLQPFNIDSTANYTFNKVTVSSNVDLSGASNVNLGAVSNIRISGGTANYVLQTDGAGNLSWVAQSGGGNSSSISNGNSNVSIPAANGNVNISSAGNANVLVVTGTGINVTGTLNTTDNIQGGNLVSANYFTGTLTTAAQPNITSVGLLTSLSVGPNSSITLTGTSGFVRANSIQGTDGVAAIYPAYGGVTGAVGITSNLTVGTGAAGNITANGNVTASYFIGNGSSLSSITGANVTGQVANALVAGTVYTNAQPNITSLGTLTDLNVSGNAIVGGNLTVNGDLVYINVTNLSVEDSVIQLQTGPNGAAPTSNSGKDVGTALNYYDTAARVGFMGWDASNAEIALASDVTLANEIATFNQYANVRAGYFIGNGSSLSNITGANVTGTVANATYATSAGSANTAGTVTNATQSNITSVGILTGLTSNGTIDFTNASNVSLGAVGNIKITGGTANYVLSTDGAGNLSWVAQSGGGGGGASISNGTSNISIDSANGNITAGVNGTANVAVISNTGVTVTGLVNVSSNVTASRFISNVATGTAPFTVTSTTQVANLNSATAGTVRTGAQPNITSVGTLTSLDVSGNITASSISGTTTVLRTSSFAANGIIQSTNRIQAPMLPTYTGIGSTTLLNKNTATGGSPTVGCVDPTGRFAYVVNSATATVSMYTIDQNGILTSIGTPVATGATPYSVAVDPTGRFVYVVNLGGNTVSQYSINQTTGALTSITTAIATSASPYDVTVDPTGRYVYTISFAGGSNPAVISGFSINQTTGALTALSPATNSISGYAGYGITVDPSGRFVYVAAGGAIGMFSINQSNGTLTSIATPLLTVNFGYGLVCEPSGRFLYFRADSANIEMFSINQTTGALTSLGSPVATGAGTSAYTKQIDVDPTGMYLYTVGTSDHSLTTFSINQKTGIITKVGNTMTGLTNNPSSVSVTPNSRFIVIPINTSNLLSVSSAESFGSFSITANTANLATANFTATTGTAPFVVNSTTQVANLNSATAGTVRTAAQPNITSVGTLLNLTSNGTINFTNASNVSLGAVGNIKITGGTSGYVLQTDGAGNLSWAAAGGGGGSPQPGTAFDTSITVSNNYAVTATMANAAVFANNAVVYSMYVTNIDSTGATGASISANFRYANGTTLSIANQIPVPYRGAVELLKQPKYFASGDAIQLQGLNNGVGASSFFHASIVYEITTDATYQYSVTNIASTNVATNVYTSTSNASIVQSVMLTNSSNLGNIPVTVTISSSANVVEGYLSSGLLLPVNSTIELCENPRNMAAGSVIQVTAGGPNTVTVTVAAKKI